VNIAEYIKSKAVTKVRRHLAVEHGHKWARRAVATLRRQLAAIQRIAAKRGETIEARNLDWTPREGIRVELWGVADQRIQWSVLLICGPEYVSRGYKYVILDVDPLHYRQSASRADQLIRHAIRAKEEWREKQRHKRLSELTAADRVVADQLRPILGANHEGRGWIAKKDGWLSTSHDYALHQVPDYRDRLTAAGWEEDSSAISTVALSHSTARWRRIAASR
jgi:hypothetical protein